MSYSESDKENDLRQAEYERAAAKHYSERSIEEQRLVDAMTTDAKTPRTFSVPMKSTDTAIEKVRKAHRARIADLQDELAEANAKLARMQSGVESAARELSARDMMIRDLNEKLADCRRDALIESLREDAKMWRYIRDNAPPEGCTVRFMPGGSAITWGVITESELGRVEDALKELVAMVRGECPSLLDEDSGGSALLSMEIDDILYSARATQPTSEGEGK